MTINIKKIDTSYWHTKDPVWVAEREAQWPKIEYAISSNKYKKKATNPIRDYFLRGKMPNWKGFQDWPDTNRHLDLFMFLWLHPSWDRQLLTELRDTYITSDLIVYEDVEIGFSNLLRYQIVLASIYYQYPKPVQCPAIPEHSGLLFDIMMGDPNITEYEINEIDQNYNDPVKKIVYSRPKSRFPQLTIASSWLLIKELKPENQGMLLQHSNVLEWWYQGVCEDEKFEVLKDKDPVLNNQYYLALYRIFQFDVKHCRVQQQINFVNGMRKILDEREFRPFFKQMWLDISSGKVIVHKAWGHKHDATVEILK